MPPRLPSQASRRLRMVTGQGRIATSSPAATAAAARSVPGSTRHYAVAASSLASAFRLPDDYVPPTKPPSARAPEVRKSQLLRSYTSLLRSTPFILMFQHNNLTAVEWAAIRRELKAALAAVPAPPVSPDGRAPVDISNDVLLQVLRTSMFNQALKIVEFYDPVAAKAAAQTPGKAGAKKEYTHDLSMAAYQAVKAAEKNISEDSAYAQLVPLLIGPLAVITFPAVSPQHLAAVLSIVAPNPPAFPAPSRKKNPGYHDLTTQSGLQKLLLVGGRIESKVFDVDGVRWVGGIEGGLEGLRGQLVAMLQSAGLGLTSALEGASKSLWMTMEGRKTMLEDAEKGGENKE
ncbi:hypothetical protein M406DRAFT_345124 [Cryphonectria parasitica EP155]|uniref:Ribosomal protein YmL11, mitochondrial n=1 Tax=Cryphonectria parasitica (strain ATCC 38755 / EP155) TaxID=660469 RepID=A0A9P4Y583_CRYP1|nr:uncharacterized protein M406DRAFT_345124 [Cryphonectria parasitica EP155]KAF3766720.1 hypothetical protein M406DRAFT_345124 [Cryphonectria parasitica EP155]